MSTSEEGATHITVEAKHIAAGVDRLLVRLLQLTPLALVVLLLSETARTYSGVVITLYAVLAIIVAYRDVSNS